jgi:hypothetical protein
MDASLLQEQIFKCCLTKSIAAIHSVFVAAAIGLLTHDEIR